MTPEPVLELYWIPLGAGATVVRRSGQVYERLTATRQHRPRCDLYHSALIATTPFGRFTIEMTPVTDPSGGVTRGVVAEGPVGSRWLGHFRICRYEIRRWLGGDIPDLRFAVASPVIVTREPDMIADVVALVADVPTPVWGRDELGTGDMWNSNSVVSWLLARAGLLGAAGPPPAHGRAPGWDAGITVARADRHVGGPRWRGLTEAAGSR
jgi:hypothetical protein